MTHLLYYSDIEGAYDEPAVIAKLAGRIAEHRCSKTIVGGAGDNTGPGVLSLLEEGRQSLAFFDRIAPDVDVFGNHDFDHGKRAAKEIVDDSPQTWLATNVYKNDGDRFAVEEGAVPSTVFERGSRRVGVFGVSHPNTNEMAPNATGLEFTDPCEAARPVVEAFEERGVDHIVGFSHCGVDDPLARRLPVDVILGGHRNERRNEDIAGTRVVRTRGGQTELVEVELGEDVSVAFHDVESAFPDEHVASRFRSLKADHNLTEVVGHASKPLDRDATSGECALGNLIADAFRWKAGTDVSLVSAGSIRPGAPHVGPITTEDILGWIPFLQSVVVTELTGEELRAVLHEGFSPGADVHSDGERIRLQVSGLNLVYDRVSDRIASLTLGGEPVSPNEMYSVATLLYVLVSESEFETMTGRDRVAEFGPHHEAIREYIESNGPGAEWEGRIRVRPVT